jgi:hypothetical protein
MKKITLLVLFAFFFPACGMQHPIQTATHYRTLTPPEYYSQTHPASFSPSPERNFSPNTGNEEVENTIPETKGDRLNVALIGILAGLAAVAGTVVPIVVLKK